MTNLTTDSLSYSETISEVLPSPYQTEPNQNGVYLKVHFSRNSEGQLVKVSTPYKNTLISTRVSASVAYRRANIPKFGLAKDCNDGTTIRGEEVFLEKVVEDEPEQKTEQDKSESEKPDTNLPTLEELLREVDPPNKVEAYKPKTWADKAKDKFSQQQEPKKYVPRFKRTSMVDKSKLFVGNIAPDQEEAEIWHVFGEFGRVRNVFIPKNREDPDTNKGFCFVSYYDERDAQAALEGLQRKAIGGMIVEVKVAEDKGR